MLGRLLVLVVVSLLAFSLCVGTTVQQRASTLRDEIKSLEQEWRAWTATAAERPPVRGEGSDGNAWLDYQAIELCYSEIPLMPAGRSVPIAEPSPRMLAALAHLRDGVQRRRVARPGPEDWSVPAFEIRRAVVLAARYAAQGSRFGDAVDYGLDLAWFGADLLRTGSGGRMYIDSACQIMATGLTAAAEQVGPRLRSALQRLDASWPRFDGALLGHMLWAAKWIDGEGAEPGLVQPGGLHFWVRRPFYLRDVPALRSQLQRNRTAAAAPWPEALRVFAANPAAGAVSKWLELGTPVWYPQQDQIQLHRREQAMLRLLLFAVTPAQAPIDPFGDGHATLRTRREADRLILWSVGPDGVDDGGRADPGGEGFPYLHDGKRAPDLVLVLPAR